MLDDDFLQLVRDAFVIEGGELVQAMKTGLLELKQSPEAARRMEVVVKIHRDAHSLKGAAATVGSSDIESVGRALEGVFMQWKTSAVTAPPETFELLNRAMDLLGNLLQPSGAAIDQVDHMQVSRMLHELATVSSTGASPTPPDSH